MIKAAVHFAFNAFWTIGLYIVFSHFTGIGLWIFGTLVALVFTFDSLENRDLKKKYTNMKMKSYEMVKDALQLNEINDEMIANLRNQIALLKMASNKKVITPKKKISKR